MLSFPSSVTVLEGNKVTRGNSVTPGRHGRDREGLPRALLTQECPLAVGWMPQAGSWNPAEPAATGFFIGTS